MKICCISDSHTFHDQIETGEGDILIHAGDLALQGSRGEVQNCLDWLNKQRFAHVIAIAGNHDWAFARESQKALLELGRVVYLEDSSVNIDGINIFGSPWQPAFCDWAFNLPRGRALKDKWDLIPDAGLVDILVTHGPPFGILDQINGRGTHLGCEDLARQVKISMPKIMCFGHIHSGFGSVAYGETRFFNCSQVDEFYRVVNKPWVIEI